MIELRWVKGYELVTSEIAKEVKVLQYRNKDRLINSGVDFLGAHFTTYGWSEWRDVPFVDGDNKDFSND